MSRPRPTQPRFHTLPRTFQMIMLSLPGKLSLVSFKLQHCRIGYKSSQRPGSFVVIGGLATAFVGLRVAALSKFPSLFRSIEKVKTQSGLTWDRAMTVRQVLTKDGRVTIATGHNADYVELATPAKIHGFLVGALFAKLWEHNDMKRLFEKDYKSLDLVAPTVLSVYNHTSKSAGLYSRMIRCKYPDLRVRIVHDAEHLLKATSFSGRHNWPNSIAGLQRRPTSTKATRTPLKRTSTPRRRRRGDGKSVARMAAAESIPWHSLIPDSSWAQP